MAPAIFGAIEAVVQGGGELSVSVLRPHEIGRIAAPPIVDTDRTEACCLREASHHIVWLVVWIGPSLSDREDAVRFEYGVTVSKHCRAIGDFAEYGA